MAQTPPTSVATDEIRRLRQDLTNQRRANAELRAANETLRPLVGKLAHRVRLEQQKVSTQRKRAEMWKERALHRVIP